MHIKRNYCILGYNPKLLRLIPRTRLILKIFFIDTKMVYLILISPTQQYGFQLTRDFTMPFLILCFSLCIGDILKLMGRSLQFTNYWFTFSIRTISPKCYCNAENIKILGTKIICNIGKL